MHGIGTQRWTYSSIIKGGGGGIAVAILDYIDLYTKKSSVLR